MKKQPKVETMSKNDFFAAVHGAAVQPSEPKAKKDKVPSIPLNEDQKVAIDSIVKWKKAEKEAKAEREALEQDIISYVLPLQEDMGFGHAYAKSFRLNGKSETITFVTSDRFSEINSEDLPTIKNLLGDRYSEFVKENLSVSFSDELLSNVELQKELMGYVPADLFKKFFTSKIRYNFTDGFDEKRFSLPRQIWSSLKNFVKQAKPSLK